VKTPDSADRPAPTSPEADNQIEVTPEMIEAGVAVLWNSGAVEHPTEADKLVVREVYLAMAGSKERSQLHF
jgi:hypothetical protein